MKITQAQPGRFSRGLLRGALFASVTCLAAFCSAAPAAASISVSSFSITPSTTTAGAAPNLDLAANFSYGGNDSVNDLTVSLAPGLLPNPTVPAQCSTTEFTFDVCPISSWIGTGTVTASSPVFFGVPAPFDANLYLVQPAAGQVARVGLIINVLGIPLISTLAPISVRTATGDVGANINLSGLPNNYDGLPLTVKGLNLTIFGSVDGQSFTRNPTGCGAAVSDISAVSYGSPSQTATSSSSFTPTSCSSLPFSPGGAATATLDSADAGVSYTAVFTQSPGQAAIKSISVTTPPALSPNLAVIAKACTSSVLSSCPSVGSATLATPLLSAPLTGNIILVSNLGALPTPIIVFSSPVALELPGTVTLSDVPSLALTTTFGNLPDLPLSKLTVTFNGGLTGLFIANPLAICVPPQDSSGTLIGQNGASLSGSVATTINGCPSVPSVASSVTNAATDTVSAAATGVVRSVVAGASGDTASKSKSRTKAKVKAKSRTRTKAKTRKRTKAQGRR